MWLNIGLVLLGLAIIAGIAELVSRYVPWHKRTRTIMVEKYNEGYYEKGEDRYIMVEETRHDTNEGFDHAGTFTALSLLALSVLMFLLPVFILHHTANASKERCRDYMELGNEVSWSQTSIANYSCLVYYQGVWVPIDQVGIVLDNDDE